jgi:hypothetical protein
MYLNENCLIRAILPSVKMAQSSELPPRKRTLNPKLLDENNLDRDAVKKRKLLADQLQSATAPSQANIAEGPSQPQKPAQFGKSTSSRQPTLEVIGDQDDATCHNAGKPRNSNVILEAADGSDDDLPSIMRDSPSPVVDGNTSPDEEEEPSKETDEEELGQLDFFQ